MEATDMAARMLESFLLPSGRWAEAPALVQAIAAQSSAEGVPTGIGYYDSPSVGWFVLSSAGQGPMLLGVWPCAQYHGLPVCTRCDQWSSECRCAPYGVADAGN